MTQQCKGCGAEYDQNEVKRTLGEDSMPYILGYCSSECYTHNKVERHRPRLHITGVRIAISPTVAEAIYIPEEKEIDELLQLPKVDEVGAYGAGDFLIFAQFDGLSDYTESIGQVMTSIHEVVRKYH